MFSEILSKLNISFEIIGYSTTGITPKQHNNMDFHISTLSTSSSYNRAENLKHDMYKRFSDDFKKVKYRLSAINATTGNYDQDHMEFVWNRLKKRPEKRKIIIWISDGMPCGGKEARYKLKSMINMISSNKGSDIIGIGIQSDYVADFYNKYV